jgi:glycogen debranching enzyme
MQTLIARFTEIILVAYLTVPAVAFGIEPGIPFFPITETALTLRAEATSRRFIAAHGRRGMVVGYAAEALEGWIYPFRILHDFRVAFRGENDSSATPASTWMRDIVVCPESVTRIYSAQNFTVRETIFVPLDQAGFVILYDVKSRGPLHIEVSFRPDLDLMWPGGIGGQSYDWDANRHAFVLQESSGKYSALVGSPAATRHALPANYAEPWNADRRLSLELEISPEAASQHYYPLVVACTIPGHYDAGKTYEQVLRETPKLYAEAADHYRKLVASNLQIETPDSDVNRAYYWARISLDQAFVCNPWLGCGLVAGYGPSRDTRRPQYAWFFGGDALINSWALEAAGDHGLAREAIRFIQKYQKKDTGEIFHELSQSAGLIDWFRDYPYGYRHTDVSAMYLVAFRQLYRASADQEFLRESWASLRSAYQYLLSRLDADDGLVTVPPGGWGGDETLGEEILKDVYLESVWIAGAEAFAELAVVMGDQPSEADARARASRARASLQAKFWNPERSFFFYGFNGRGELLTQEMGQPNWGIWLGVFDRDKAEHALDRMARANFLADWGLRSIPQDDRLFQGESYGHGSVWPLGTGVQSLAFYRYHRPLQGYPLWRTLIDQSFLNSLGHVPEAFSGEFYRELDVSVPEQIWSSGMVVTTLLRGLLGIEPDAPAGRLSWSPHLPANWPFVKIRNLKIGQSVLNLEMEQADSQVSMHLENAGPALEVEFAPEIPLGPAAFRAVLNGKPIPASLRAHSQDAHSVVQFRAEKTSQLTISFEPGVRPWQLSSTGRIGDESRGLRILSSSLRGRIYRAEVEGVPGACSPLVISTPWQISQVKGGKVTSHREHEWRLMVSPTRDSCNGDATYKTWALEVEFATASGPR